MLLRSSTRKNRPAKRSIVPRRVDAVTERDPRRHRGLSPNSRQSRRRPRVAASSHQQDRDNSMDGSTTNSSVSFVGIDVAKLKFDVAILPEGARLTLRLRRRRHRSVAGMASAARLYHCVGGHRRFRATPGRRAGRCRPPGGDRQSGAGWRDFAGAASACWPRTIASMPACWRSAPHVRLRWHTKPAEKQQELTALVGRADN